MAPIHILILGGDVKFLPLAKSKVRALADRVGPDGYATEKLIIDGTTIHVEVKKGIQRITMSGSSGLFMDTGAVDIQTVTVTDPAIGDTDGILNYNTTQAAQAEQQRLLGTIAIPGLNCNPPEDGAAAKSFKAKVTDGARVSASEDLLAVKKACSKLSPPSHFTGKMRLFVQAKYGQALSEWGFSLNTANQPPSLDATYSGIPFQLVPGQCGIYTDTRKRHYLVQIGMDGQESYDGVTIYRLTVPQAVESLRSMLLDIDRSTEERERIEAYLLSVSRPAVATKVQLSMQIEARSSMGWGWHFNWSGSSADIVAHTSDVFGSGLQYQASHYRLALLLSEAGEWSGEITVEERVTWGNNKWKTVIAYPDWAESKLLIFGSTFGLKQASNAPVYCFWRRDNGAEVFEMIRYSYTAGVTGTRGAFISDPPYYYGISPEAPGLPVSPGCATQGVSVGLEATRYDSITYPATATSSTFSSSSETVSLSARSYSNTGVEGTEKATIRAGLRSGPSAGNPAQPIYDGVPGNQPVFGGGQFCATGPASGLGAFTGNTPWGGTMNIYSSRVTWDQRTFSDSVTQDFASVLVIPFGDAEAVYIHGKEYRLVSSTTVSTRAMDSGLSDNDYVQYNTITDSFGNTFEWVNYGSGIDSDHLANPPVASGIVTTTPEDERWTVVASKCISNAGVRETSWSPDSAFFAGDPAETVDQQLLTLTSASDGDIKGENIDLTGGYDASVSSAPFVFVGWA